MASRLEMRKMAEAAEARASDMDSSDDDGGEGAEPKKRKRVAAGAAKKKVVKKKSRTKPVERRRIVWVIFNSTQKEEGRFNYDQRQAAEERLEVLRSKSKRLYWLQAVKEVIGASPVSVAAPDVLEEAFVPEAAAEEEEVIDIEEEFEEEEDEEEEEEEEEDDE